MSDKENLTEKDKLYRTIRRLLIVGAGVLVVFLAYYILDEIF